MDRTLAFIIVAVIAFTLPLLLVIIWRKKTKCNFMVFLVGTLCFMLFANLLESILHTYLLAVNKTTSTFIYSKPIYYALYGGLSAGIFEECGRLFGFKVLLRKYDVTKELAVGYGIGHGGIECILMLGGTYLLYSLALLGVSFGDEATTSMVLQTVNSIDLNILPVAVIERLLAMCLHIGLSIFVFKATTDKKYFYMFPVAILVHMIADIPAGLYQQGVITSLLLVEGLTAIVAISTLFIAIRIYNNIKGEE